MKEIILPSKHIVLVDDEDFEWLSQFNWHVEKRVKTQYAVRKIGKKSQYIHTIISGYAITDHKNGLGLDNQRSNLREATQAENQWNSGKPVTNTSGYKGVGWHRAARKLEVRIKVNRKQIYLGLSDNLIEAALLYDRAARRYHGGFAYLNFPEIVDYSMLPPMRK